MRSTKLTGTTARVSVAFEAILLLRVLALMVGAGQVSGFSRLRGDSFIEGAGQKAYKAWTPSFQSPSRRFFY